MRMVFGYRAGYPLLGKDTAGAGLPRSASAMAQVGPGTSIVGDTGQRPPSSRESADGPTFGDAGGGSVIDGDGKYTQAFRAAKRL
ncbi:MAG TPA: hypothetical protein VHZ97_05960 [Pseudonocardiaceae bacterium]|nr:hypothetical protein [Pseudonocardiaceae bacterium]